MPGATPLTNSFPLNAYNAIRGALPAPSPDAKPLEAPGSSGALLALTKKLLEGLTANGNG